MGLERVWGLADYLGKRGDGLKLIAQGAAQLRTGQQAQQDAAAQAGQPPVPASQAAPHCHAEGLEPNEWALLRVMIAAAQVDGRISPEEQQTVLQWAQQLHATPAQIQSLQADMQTRISAQAIVQSVDSVETRKLMYKCAVAVLRSDRDLAQQEVAFLRELANATELADQVLARIVT